MPTVTPNDQMPNGGPRGRTGILKTSQRTRSVSTSTTTSSENDVASNGERSTYSVGGKKFAWRDPPIEKTNGVLSHPLKSHNQSYDSESNDSLSTIQELQDDINHSIKELEEDLGRSETQNQRPQQEEELGDFRFRDQDLVGQDHEDDAVEARAKLLFSRQHLEAIFEDMSLLTKFTSYVGTYRPQSVPILIYYLNGLKALKAIKYANAIVEGLEAVPGHDFTSWAEFATISSGLLLEDKMNRAFDVLVQDVLPAYIAYVYVHVVGSASADWVTGKFGSDARKIADGLGDVFCLSDPTRPDNPIVFASQDFHRMTQYPASYAIGRNCRIFQGPKTDPMSVARVRYALEDGREHCEVLLNYHRDGTPYMNLFMCVPLRDQVGKVKYFLGAQLDITSIVKDCTALESLQKVFDAQRPREGQKVSGESPKELAEEKDQFKELCELFNEQELDELREMEGRKERRRRNPTAAEEYGKGPPQSKGVSSNFTKDTLLRGQSVGKSVGFYENYLLVRPAPSLRILFVSPSLRLPGILQSPFMGKIGGSDRVRNELLRALEAGQNVTAKVRWIPKAREEGRSRWIHCTPLYGSTGQIGVWMVLIVEDEEDGDKQARMAPAVKPAIIRMPPIIDGVPGPKLESVIKEHDDMPTTIRIEDDDDESLNGMSTPTTDSEYPSIDDHIDALQGALSWRPTPVNGDMSTEEKRVNFGLPRFDSFGRRPSDDGTMAAQERLQNKENRTTAGPRFTQPPMGSYKHMANGEEPSFATGTPESTFGKPSVVTAEQNVDVDMTVRRRSMSQPRPGGQYSGSLGRKAGREAPKIPAMLPKPSVGKHVPITSYRNNSNKDQPAKTAPPGHLRRNSHDSAIAIATISPPSKPTQVITIPSKPRPSLDTRSNMNDLQSAQPTQVPKQSQAPLGAFKARPSMESGRMSSQDGSEDGRVRRTYKSLSPYGMLFND